LSTQLSAHRVPNDAAAHGATDDQTDKGRAFGAQGSGVVDDENAAPGAGAGPDHCREISGSAHPVARGKHAATNVRLRRTARDDPCVDGPR
jgi:hypothetical protein